MREKASLNHLAKYFTYTTYFQNFLLSKIHRIKIDIELWENYLRQNLLNVINFIVLYQIFKQFIKVF